MDEEEKEGHSCDEINQIIHGRFNFNKTEIWKEVSENAIVLIKKLLETNPSKRIEAVHAMNDKWLLILTKQRKNNQIKFLNPKVLPKL